MLNKYIFGTVLLTTATMSQAGLVFNSEITGADMAGIEVTVDFTGGGSESSFWSVLSTDLGSTGNTVADYEGFQGGASGTGWSLTQSGFTLGNIQLDPTYELFGLWSFTDTTNTVNKITINTGDTGIVFDTASIDDLSEDSNGSGQGREFLTSTPSEVTATYSDLELQELYNTLTLELETAGTDFSFMADTDFVQGDVVLEQDEVISVANEEQLNETLTAATTDAGDLVSSFSGIDQTITEEVLQEFIEDAASDGNEVAQAIQNNSSIVAALVGDPDLLNDAAATDITSLPVVIANPTSAEDIATNARNEQIIEIVEEIIANEIRSGDSGSSVTGNGDINVEIARETGEVTFGLTVSDEESGEAVLFTNLIDTPEQAFSLDFNLFFETLTGSLTVSLENAFNQLIDITYQAEDFQSFTSVSWFINDSRFFGLTDANLTYSLFPGSPATALINDINVSYLPTNEVPAPTSITLLGLSVLGLAIRRTRRKQA